MPKPKAGGWRYPIDLPLLHAVVAAAPDATVAELCWSTTGGHRPRRGRPSRIGERLEGAGPPKPAGIKRLLDVLEKEAPEKPREDPYGQEEARATGDPARAVAVSPPPVMTQLRCG